MTTLATLGWEPFYEQQLTPEEIASLAAGTLLIGRIVEQHRGLYKFASLRGVGWARPPSDSEKHDPVAVGDWAIARTAAPGETVSLLRRLERKNKLSRKSPKGHEQSLAVNIDTAFVVTSLNQDLNLRRLERYLTLIRENGVEPVVVLTKADLLPNAEKLALEVREVARSAPVHVVTDTDDSAKRELGRYFLAGKTVLLLGSSGVGKSTLVNLLFDNESQAVDAVREGDDKGRHTTTARRLLTLPSGGMLIDSPGMREIQLLDSSEGVRETFDDLVELATGCRFSNCGHASEPACAVRDALKKGTLSAERFASFQKLGEQSSTRVRHKKKRH